MYPRPLDCDDPWGPDNLRKIDTVWYDNRVCATNPDWPVGLEGDTVEVMFRKAGAPPAGFALKSLPLSEEAPLMDLSGIPTPPTPPLHERSSW